MVINMAKAKNDTNKDLLFSKLLPALNNNPFSSTYQGAPKETEVHNESKEEESSVSILRNRLFARATDRSTDTYVAVNIMEDLIPKYIDQVVHRFNACSCDRCRCDIAAHVLNSLPPKYVVINPKTFTAEDDPAIIKQVMDALVNAVIHIRSHPNH